MDPEHLRAPRPTIEHTRKLPLATLNFHDKGGEIAAVRALLEQTPVAGRVITIDALHTTRDTARTIVDTHGADYLMSVKENASETYNTLGTINWERDATGHFEEPISKAHGRLEQRRIEVMTPPSAPHQLSPRRADLPHHPRAHRHQAQRHRTDHLHARLWHHLGAGATRDPATAPRLEPRPLVGRGQPPHQGHNLRRGRLPRAHPIRAREQRDLHQPRARADYPQDPLRQLRFRDTTLRAATRGRLHGPALALTPRPGAPPRPGNTRTRPSTRGPGSHPHPGANTRGKHRRRPGLTAEPLVLEPHVGDRRDCSGPRQEVLPSVAGPSGTTPSAPASPTVKRRANRVQRQRPECLPNRPIARGLSEISRNRPQFTKIPERGIVLSDQAGHIDLFARH